MGNIYSNKKTLNCKSNQNTYHVLKNRNNFDIYYCNNDTREDIINLLLLQIIMMSIFCNFLILIPSLLIYTP